MYKPIQILFFRTDWNFFWPALFHTSTSHNIKIVLKVNNNFSLDVHAVRNVIIFGHVILRPFAHGYVNS